MTRSPTVVLGLVVAAIVVAAGVTAAVTADRGGVEAGTPEATVRDYVRAVLEHDSDKAARSLGAESPCTVTDLDAAFVPDDVQVSLRDVRVDRGADGDKARVRVVLTHDSAGLVPAAWTEEQTFRLVRDGGTWRITGAPWPLYDCGAP